MKNSSAKFKLQFGKDPELVAMAFDSVSQKFNKGDYDRDDYVAHLSVVIYQYFKKGSARRLVRALKNEPERTLKMFQK